MIFVYLCVLYNVLLLSNPYKCQDTRRSNVLPLRPDVVSLKVHISQIKKRLEVHARNEARAACSSATE